MREGKTKLEFDSFPMKERDLEKKLSRPPEENTESQSQNGFLQDRGKEESAGDDR
jgi:hypothetical protein